MVNSAQRLAVPVGADDYTQGPDNAAVTLVEYGDYECPYCKQAASVVKQLQQEFGEQLRYCFRNFPLTQIHPYAYGAAEAAEAAGHQGKFWQMHDLLYQQSPALSTQDLMRYAQQIGLDLNTFQSALQNDTYRQEIESDVRSGLESGVQGTPTFFVNGSLYQGPAQPDAMAQAINETAGGD